MGFLYFRNKQVSHASREKTVPWSAEHSAMNTFLVDPSPSRRIQPLWERYYVSFFN
jgi:hypothetical protein